ncbi:MAG TPA: hypothetical protein VNP92_29245 [Actinophytocola sp.]|nr:hypothetical protein [Actinophytocola sp.]
MVTGIVAVVSVVGVVGAVISLSLVLRFLRHVYDNGGADDLEVAAKAVRVARRPFPRRPPAELDAERTGSAQKAKSTDID